MAMNKAVSYTPNDISSKEKTGDMITFAHFEEGDLLSESRDYSESGSRSDDD